MKELIKYKFKCPKCENDQFIVKFENVVHYAVATGCGTVYESDKLYIDYWDEEVEDYNMDEAVLTKIFCENFDCDWVAPFKTEEEMIIFLRESNITVPEGVRRSAIIHGTHTCLECNKSVFPFDNSLDEQEHKHLQCPECGSVRLEELKTIGELNDSREEV